MPAGAYKEEGGPTVEFEERWLAKLNHCLTEYYSVEKASRLLQGSDPENKVDKVIDWTRALVEKLEQEDPVTAKDVFTCMACQYPKANLTEISKIYRETKDIKKAHSMLQEQFIETIRKYLCLSEEEIRKVEERGWGVAGRIDGNKIISTKMPFDWAGYWAEDDPEKRKFHFCHCPRIRDILRKGDPSIGETYCLCGGGFYKSIWEHILDSPVKVKVLKTVMKGDQVCQFEILLSEEL
jgi:hypothetical protein